MPVGRHFQVRLPLDQRGGGFGEMTCPFFLDHSSSSPPKFQLTRNRSGCSIWGSAGLRVLICQGAAGAIHNSAYNFFGVCAIRIYPRSIAQIKYPRKTGQTFRRMGADRWIEQHDDVRPMIFLGSAARCWLAGTLLARINTRKDAGSPLHFKYGDGH